MEQELKDFIKANVKLSAVAAVYIADKTGAAPEHDDIQMLIASTLSETLEELQENKPDLNDLIDAGEQVVLTGGNAFGSAKAKQLCQDIVDASNAGQEGQYLKVVGEGFQIIHGIKAVARENKKKG